MTLYPHFNHRGRLPLLIRFGIRLAIFIAAFFAIGLASAIAEHFLVSKRHYDLISETDLALYRGSLNMLLILWFLDLLKSDSDGSPEGGDAEGGSVRSTTARAGTASPETESPL